MGSLDFLSRTLINNNCIIYKNTFTRTLTFGSPCINFFKVYFSSGGGGSCSMLIICYSAIWANRLRLECVFHSCRYRELQPCKGPTLGQRLIKLAELEEKLTREFHPLNLAIVDFVFIVSFDWTLYMTSAYHFWYYHGKNKIL